MILERLRQTTAVLATQTILLSLVPASALATTFRLEEATIGDIQSAFSSGILTCSQLTQLYLDRIAAYDKQGSAINSIIATNPNALAIAAELDAKFAESGSTGSLHCIPVIAKDNYNTFDMPTTAGALALEGFIPDEDAFMVNQLRDAGALILAKSNLSEFAFTFTSNSSLGGLTLNPYDTDRNAGGSSGGSGAAIAANFGVIGLGTDTGGSIRIPSSFNSLVGIRPTIGLTSRSGIVPLALSQDVGGPMTRTVTDAAIALDVLAGFDPDDPVTASSIGEIPDSYTDFLDAKGLQGARIGVVRDLFGLDSNPQATKVNTVIDAALADMKRLGAEVVDNVTIPNLDSILSFPSLSSFEFKSNLNNYLAQYPNAPVNSLTEIIESGRYLPEFEQILKQRNQRGPLESDPEYQRIIRQRPVLTQTSLLAALEGLDALLFPTAINPPNLLEEPVISGAANRLSPFSGFPEITVPAGFTSDGLPVGIELLGREFEEETLIKLAYAYEQGTMRRRPPSSTPPLPGETITVPEPSNVATFALLGLTFTGLKLTNRRKNRRN